MYGQDVPGTNSSAGVFAEGLGKQFGDLWALATSTSTFPPGRSSACSATTAPARRRRSGSSPPSPSRRPGAPGWPGSTSSPTPRGCAPRSGSQARARRVDGLLTARANLEMIGRLYHLPRAVARRRADELLERLDIADAADRLVRTFSGGMRRRLDLAASLVASPPVLFLDEPTTGLDPRGRNDLWEFLRELVARRRHPRADHPVPRGGRPARRRHRACSTTAASWPPARPLS